MNSRLCQHVVIGVRKYLVDLDGEHVYVLARSNPDAPHSKEFLREIPWTGPKAMEARQLALQGLRAERRRQVADEMREVWNQFAPAAR